MSSEEEKPLAKMAFTLADRVTEEMLADKAALVVEVVEENYHDAPIVGIAVVNEHGRFFLRPETALADPQFVAWLGDETKKKSMFDSKRAAVALKWKGIELCGVSFDLLLAAYLLDPAQGVDDVAAAAKMKQYEAVRSDEAVYGKGAKRAVPDEPVLAEHLVRKAAAIWALERPFLDELRRNEQDRLLVELEQPLSSILAEMEFAGVKVDTKRLEQMGEELAEQLRTVEQRIYELAGQEFNINSPKQLGVILFEKLQLPVLKKTKTGYSTSADVLEKLAPYHEIVENILHYRQLGKLQSTYIEGLLKVVRPEIGRAHV